MWQRSYFERIVRDETALPKIREYILNNPLRWSFDRNNPANSAIETGGSQTRSINGAKPPAEALLTKRWSAVISTPSVASAQAR